MEVVETTLRDIGAGDKPTILVFNKMDRIKSDPEYADEEGNFSLERLQESLMHQAGRQDNVYISAANKQNIDELREKLIEKVKARHFVIYPNYLDHQVYELALYWLRPQRM
jgi:GTP-binding protein HflX